MHPLRDIKLVTYFLESYGSARLYRSSDSYDDDDLLQLNACWAVVLGVLLIAD